MAVGGLKSRQLCRGAVLVAGLTIGLATGGARAEEPQGATESVTVIGQAGRLADLPVSATSLTAKALQQDGINGLFDLGQVVPGLRVDRYGGATQPTLRGIGVQNVLGPGINSDVAIYVDGYYQTSLDGIFDFADVTRVDVLKGPQGTLFGQNSTGGAILLTTADPDFATHGFAVASIGSFNDVREQAYFTVGLSSTVAADLSIYHRSSDNYFTDIISGQPSAPIESLAVRSKLLFQPDAQTRLVLTAQFSDMDDPTSLAYVVHHPVAALYHDVFGLPQSFTETPYKTSLSHRIVAEPKTYALSLTGEFELGWASLTSRSQFRKERGHVLADLDGTSTPYWNSDYVSRDQTVSQEFDLAGNTTGRLQWQAGLYYDNDLGSLLDNTSQDIFSTGVSTSLFHTNIRVATDSVALFGDVTYALAPDWLLTAGARATHDRKSLYSVGLDAPFILARDARSWDDLSPRLALRHALDADSNVYLSVTRGFKSGNYSYLGLGPQTPVKSEQVTQYEAGYKRAGAAWSLDAAAYMTDYRNLQAFTYMSACACFQFANAPRARVYGVEGSSHVALDENLSLNAGMAWTHARYQQFTGENPTGAPYIPPIYGYATGPTNFAGGSMIRSPDWTGNAGLDWRIPSDFGLWDAAANLYLTSRVPFTPDRLLSQAGYGLLNLSLGWTAPDALWSITASGQNVTGQRYQTFSAEGFLGNSIVYGAPASWLLRVERSFF